MNIPKVIIKIPNDVRSSSGNDVMTSLDLTENIIISLVCRYRTASNDEWFECHHLYRHKIASNDGSNPSLKVSIDLVDIKQYQRIKNPD